jgi:hypothetical protein
MARWRFAARAAGLEPEHALGSPGYRECAQLLGQDLEACVHGPLPGSAFARGRRDRPRARHASSMAGADVFCKQGVDSQIGWG